MPKTFNRKDQNFSRVAGAGLPAVKAVSSTSNKLGKHLLFDGDGIAIKTNDNYPQILAQIAAESPTHGSAINCKSMLVFGQGVPIEEIQDEKAKIFLLDCNKWGESINDILERVAIDINIFDGFALLVEWNVYGAIAYIDHVPFKNVRISDIDEVGRPNSYVVSNYWGNSKLPQQLRKEYNIPAFDPSKINKAEGTEEEGFRVNEQTANNRKQLVYYRGYSAAFDGFYPVPKYAHCLDAILTEISIGIAIKKGQDNGISGAYIVSHTKDTVASEEGKQQMTETLTDVAAGSANANSIFYLPVSVNVDKLEPVSGKTFTLLDTKVKQDIVTGHLIPAILLELSKGGGFNNRGEEMREAIKQVEARLTKGIRQKITRVFNSVLSHVKGDFKDFLILPFLTEEETKEEVIQEAKKEEDQAGIK